MGLIDEVMKMQAQGMSSQDISLALQQEGIDKRKIIEVLSQTAIKNAVSNSKEESPATISEYSQDTGMEQSVMSNAYPEQNNPENKPQPQNNQEEQSQEANYGNYSKFSNPQNLAEPQATQPQTYNEGYQNYDSSSGNSDNMSEIAQQVFDEKISLLSRKVESILDSKNETESKLESLDLRLQKIEKIIDRLQLSILQKVGEYMTNVEDIKKEISETQKTFKYLVKDKPAL